MSTQAFHDDEVAAALAAVETLLGQIGKANGGKQIALLMVSGNYRRGTLAGQPVAAGVTVGQLVDGQLGANDFGAQDVYGHKAAKPLRDALEQLADLLQRYARLNPARSTLVIVRWRASGGNGPDACWRYFDGRPAPLDASDLDLAVMVGVSANMSANS